MPNLPGQKKPNQVIIIFTKKNMFTDIFVKISWTEGRKKFQIKLLKGGY